MQDSLIQLGCLKTACTRLGFLFAEKDENGNLVEVDAPSGKLLFSNFTTPFNSGSVEHVCRDKGFTYTLVHKTVSMPRTIGYFDPTYREGYERFKTFADVGRIVAHMESVFVYPFVIKKNSGTRGINVFLCHNRRDVEKALEAIYGQDSSEYDYIALAQDYVVPHAHIRAVWFKGEILLSYNSQALWSPPVKENTATVSAGELQKFLAPITEVFPIQFAGADILVDGNGKLWLLELNSRPGFGQFIRENGEEPVAAMYERILKNV